MTRAQNRVLPLLLLPALLGILIFMVLPAVWSVYISFTDMALAGPKALNMTFIGLKNYVRLFSSEGFYHSLILTLEYSVFTNVGQFIIGLSAALLISRRKFVGKNFLMAVIVLPMVIPGITQALIWSSMLGAQQFGTLNRIIGLIGIAPVLWTQSLPMLSIVLVNLWNNTGFAMILFLAGFESIPHELLEAAQMDGASGWQQLIYLKLPLIRYMVLLWLLLNTIGCLGMFDLVYGLTRGGPGNATELLGIYIYNRGFRFYELGFGSAASLVLLVVSLALSFLYLRLLRVDLD